MTPEEKQKADAWMLLKDKDLVSQRIQDVFIGLFRSREAARWVSQHLIEAEEGSHAPPLQKYFERQLERNLRMILAEGVQDRLEEIVRPLVYEAVQRHVETVDKQLAEMRRLKSKGPINARR